MSDRQSEISSSVAPGDSVSSRGGKKGKPGKAERAARRAGQGSTPGVAASSAKASLFSSAGQADINPTPGKFPVVFATGAGEPTRDAEFSYDFSAVKRCVVGFGDRYVKNARYSEFKANSGVADSAFKCYLAASCLLGLAQQTVHAHVNMGLPQGDFAPVSSSEVLNFTAVKAYIGQFGEFAVPSTGTRYMLADYQSTVCKLVYLADKCLRDANHNTVLSRAWLPMSSGDRTTKVVIAAALSQLLSNAELKISSTVLEDAVLSGDVPDAWNAVKTVFGDAPGEGVPDARDRFDFLFKSYADVGQFTTAFTTGAASAVLAELHLPWSSPSAGHLDWDYNPKTRFSALADSWARISASYSGFFHMASGLSDRSNALGSESQFVEVRSIDSVTVVKTFLALSAPQFSLAACFPPECIFVGSLDRRVVVTTPIPVSQRATEFCLRDWK
ncbi:coat protein [Gremmeniella abietina RNA virus MS2]|uniref:Coat protein n=1 Tax=Gremmeniella abietina RNA virus MS2 TaxID=279540 RepID=Q6GYB8_9VIRU|nr:coat protein [Gremmeniella abietina RNA virus MS2]